MTLAFLGPPGTYGEQAALRCAPASELLACASHAAVAAAVRDGRAARGLLAVENSLEGSVVESLDLLIQDETLHACQELALPIEHCLIVAPGGVASAVRVIVSHTNALGQCRAFIEREFPSATLEPALSTAGAVQAALARREVAAIASERAAALLGAVVLRRGIQDRQNNVTRFLVIAHADAEPTGNDKTSLAFTTPHDRPGTLAAVLQEFSAREINLTKIESRPSKDALGVYVFLVDLLGHRRDPAVASALTSVQQKTQTLRVIGSYPRVT